LAPLFKFLDDRKIPHLLFINKMDVAAHRVREVLQALQGVSSRPLVLRQVPIRDGDSITGFVDLVSERAYRYKPGQDSELIQMPETARDREQSARTQMLESLADFDDDLLAQLLEDAVPSPEKIYQQLTKDLTDDLIVPVLLGSAERDHGVLRLWKALRHEVPGPAATAARIGAGTVQDGTTLGGHRVSGISRLKGHELQKLTTASLGEVVALGRMDAVATGTVLTASGKPAGTPSWPAAPSPLFSLAI